MMRPGTAPRSLVPVQHSSRPNTANKPDTATSPRSATSLLRVKREQQTLVAMLESCIADTYKRPPDDISDEDIAQRRAELEAMLAAVRNERLETNNEAARLQAERWAAALRAQMDREERILKQGEAKTHRAFQHAKEYRQMIGEKHRAQRDYRETHTAQAFEHLDNVFMQRMSTLELAIESQKEKQRRLQEARSRKRDEERTKQLRAERHAQELLMRKQQLDEERQRQLDETAALHRKRVEERSQIMATRRAELLNTVRAHQRTAHAKGQVDYEKLRQQEAKLQEKRDHSLQEALELKARHRLSVQQKFGLLHEKQLTNRDQVVEQRLQRQMSLLESERQRFREIEEALRQQARLLEQQARERDAEIQRHQRQCQEVYHGKINETSNSIYRRWTTKAAHIAQQLARMEKVKTPRAEGSAAMNPSPPSPRNEPDHYASSPRSTSTSPTVVPSPLKRTGTASRLLLERQPSVTRGS